MARTSLLPARTPWTPIWWPFRGFGDWSELEALDPSLRPDDVIRVEEFMDGDTLVVRAEAPGVDPDKDVDISISGGMLHISVSRETKREHTDKDRFRSEFRYGSFARSIPLPRGTEDSDVQATYDNGVLEVRVPIPAAAARRIAVKHGNGAPADAG